MAYDRVTIRNAGSEVIRQNDFIESISLKAPPNITIISVNASDKNQRWQPTHINNLITLPKNDFNTGEVIKIDVVYEYEDKEWNQKWQWAGNIAHVKEIQYKSSRVPQSLDHLDDSEIVLFYEKLLLNKRPSGILIFLYKWEIAAFCLFFIVVFNFALVMSKWKSWLNFNRLSIAKLICLCLSSMAMAEIFVYLVFKQVLIMGSWVLVWIFCGVIHTALIILLRYRNKHTNNMIERHD